MLQGNVVLSYFFQLEFSVSGLILLVHTYLHVKHYFENYLPYLFVQSFKIFAPEQIGKSSK